MYKQTNFKSTMNELHITNNGLKLLMLASKWHNYIIRLNGIRTEIYQNGKNITFMHRYQQLIAHTNNEIVF